MKRVLLVTVFFPPSQVVGAVRPSKLAKYLPAHGWEPTVLTVDHFRTRPATRPLEIPEDQVLRAVFPDPVGAAIMLARRLGKQTAAARPTGAAPANEAAAGGGLKTLVRGLVRQLSLALPINVIRFPDRAAPWLGPAYLAASRQLARQPHQAIISSSPPPSVHLLACALGRRHGLPWLADYRDPWSQNESLRRRPPWQQLEERLERATVAAAGSVVGNTPSRAKQLQTFLGRPVVAITNGFDPDEAALDPRPSGSTLSLTYTGAIYAGLEDPTPLLDALESVGTDAPLRVRFYGPDLGPLPQEATARGLGALLSCHGPVSREEALARQQESAALLLFDPVGLGAVGCVPMKFYEYLLARRPILLIGRDPESSAGRMLRDCQAGVYARNAAEVAAQLRRWQGELADTGVLRFGGDEDAIDHYAWPRLAARFAAELNRISGT